MMVQIPKTIDAEPEKTIESKPKQEIASYPLLRLGAKGKIRQKNKKTMLEDTSEPMLLEREMATNYFTVRGLTTLIGCEKRDFDLIPLKEFVDNGLDACKVNPTINAVFQLRDFPEPSTITVEDNGKGIDKDTIHKIFDYSKLTSSKFNFRLPTRGLWGHGDKVVGGESYALSKEADVPVPNPQIQIWSRNREYSVNPRLNGETQKPEPNIGEPQPCNFSAGTRIAVSLCLPKADKILRYVKMIHEYAIFNPDANLHFLISGHLTYLELDYPAICDVHKRFSGGPSIFWFSLDDFTELIEAIYRNLKTNRKDLSITQFIHDQRFKGLTSDKKASDIGHELEDEYQVKRISQVVCRKDLIKLFYQKIRDSSTIPSPDVVGEIGKKAICKRISQIFGPIKEFKYKPVRRNHSEDNVTFIPYVLEVAIAVVEDDCGRQLLTGINRSASIKNPFQGWDVPLESGKIIQLTEGTLQKYEIDEDQNVVVVIHLTCPSVEVESGGKGKININPFGVALAQTLVELCRFYPSYKIRGTRIGRQSRATVFLKKELLRRKGLLDSLGAMPPTETATQQSLFYKVRKQMGGCIDIKRENFIAAVRKLCAEIGGDPSYRDKLGITAAERAQLFFRGQVTPISLESIEELAKKGCDVILIEKEGVCEVLVVFADRRGVALVNSRGFASDYAKQLLELARRSKGHIWLLTDMDASGLLMYRNTLKGEIPRLGIDEKMLKKLGISREEVEEKYEVPSKHLKALPPEDQELVKNTRVEIDAVLAAVGPEKFWNYIEEQIQELAPLRDMNRSIDLTVKLPDEIAGPISTITEFIQSVASKKQQEIKETLREWKDGVVNVEEKEEEFQFQMRDEMLKNTQVQDLTRQLKAIADVIPKNPEKTNPNKLG
jgi:DNA topoisomerase VI subunit B